MFIVGEIVGFLENGLSTAKAHVTGRQAHAAMLSLSIPRYLKRDLPDGRNIHLVSNEHDHRSVVLAHRTCNLQPFLRLHE